MAYTERGRRRSFDNIAVGSVTGRERTIAGGGGERTVTLYAGGERKTAVSTSPTTVGIEHFIAGTTDQTNA